MEFLWLEIYEWNFYGIYMELKFLWLDIYEWSFYGIRRWHFYGNLWMFYRHLWMFLLADMEFHRIEPAQKKSSINIAKSQPITHNPKLFVQAVGQTPTSCGSEVFRGEMAQKKQPYQLTQAILVTALRWSCWLSGDAPLQFSVLRSMRYTKLYNWLVVSTRLKNMKVSLDSHSPIYGKS